MVIKNKRIVAAVASICFASAMFAAPMQASAESGGNYDTVIGGTRTTTFDKYMVMHTSAHVPDAEYTFTITNGEAVPATATTAQVFAGIGTPKFLVDDTTHTGSATPGKVVFSNSDTTYLESSLTAASSDKPAFTTTGEGNTADEKYAKKTLTITFPADTPFKQPGIYRYIITESGSASIAEILETAE